MCFFLSILGFDRITVLGTVTNTVFFDDRVDNDTSNNTQLPAIQRSIVI